MGKRRRRSSKRGLPPGSAVYVGDKSGGPVTLRLTTFAGAQLEERVITDVAEARAALKPGQIVWLDVVGVHDISVVQRVGEAFNLHILTVEDIVNTEQRPVLQQFQNYLFIVARADRMDGEICHLSTEQVSIVLGDGFVLSFQETPADPFGTVRERLRKGQGRLRFSGACYLAYTLLDAIVDGYFTVLESLDDELDTLEESVLRGDSDLRPVLRRVHPMRRRTLTLRRSVWPLREVMSTLMRDDSPFVAKETRVFFRDLYEHVIQVIETAEVLRDGSAGLVEVLLSNANYRLGEVMKVLTIIATIFIPLTFISSIYGMNFDFMPELHWRYGYAYSLVLMAVVALIMLVRFRRRGWL